MAKKTRNVRTVEEQLAGIRTGGGGVDQTLDQGGGSAPSTVFSEAVSQSKRRTSTETLFGGLLGTRGEVANELASSTTGPSAAAGFFLPDLRLRLGPLTGGRRVGLASGVSGSPLLQRAGISTFGSGATFQRAGLNRGSLGRFLPKGRPNGRQAFGLLTGRSIVGL